MRNSRFDPRRTSNLAGRFLLGFFVVTMSAVACAAPRSVSYSISPSPIEAYDYAEVTATVDSPDARDPFKDASLSGTFETDNGNQHWTVEGFCDSADGTIFRIRFMPSHAGIYKYSVRFTQGKFEKISQGTFKAVDAHRRGPIRDDPQFPWHFIWEGTGEHYFFNGTTAYWLMGWRDDSTIQYSIARLHRLKVNRIRVSIAGRENTAFGEPVMAGSNWTYMLAPWPAENPEDFFHPGFDFSRFNLPYWQKWDRMLAYARSLDMVISLVLDMNDSHIHTQAGSEDEHRFIRYAAARFAAFPNITWDLGDDLESFRDDQWAHDTGTRLEQWDPYQHLATSHPIKTTHQDRASAWFGFTSYQEWSRDQHRVILESRKLQEKTGRIIPQTNEEYGYEDHYPLWALPGSDSAEVLRRTAWDIVMAGGYQTAGETARRGINIRPDTGGGWMGGRGDDSMTMFLGYGHMVDFMTSFEWWKTNPHDELVDNGNYCLADPGRAYAVYLPKGGKVTIQLQPGHYQGYWFSALTGQIVSLPSVEGPSWTSSDAPDENDWALLLQAK
jgi:hypothetical protein